MLLPKLTKSKKIFYPVRSSSQSSAVDVDVTDGPPVAASPSEKVKEIEKIW